MPSNPRDLTALNWQRFVDAAIARRKAERMTQRRHAALAGVSIPTIAAFERGETTLSLAKAFDILRVVGLLDEPREGGAQERFLRESIERWTELVATLPPESPARFPDGFYRMDYWLDGPLKHVSARTFEGLLRDVAKERYTGWPAFMAMTREELAPREVDGAIETWLRPGDEQMLRSFSDPAHSDFWRGVPEGRLFLIRGYDEDGQQTFAPGTVFDSILPVWRIGEVLLHAARLAAHMADNLAATTIRLRVLYTGMQGRLLRSWANPTLGVMPLGRPARSDEVLLEAAVPVLDIPDKLAGHLLPLMVQLYERFDVEGLSAEQVQSELSRLASSRF